MMANTLALQQWMMFGPEMACLIKEFELEEETRWHYSIMWRLSIMPLRRWEIQSCTKVMPSISSLL